MTKSGRKAIFWRTVHVTITILTTIGSTLLAMYTLGSIKIQVVDLLDELLLIFSLAVVLTGTVVLIRYACYKGWCEAHKNLKVWRRVLRYNPDRLVDKDFLLNSEGEPPMIDWWKIALASFVGFAGIIAILGTMLESGINIPSLIDNAFNVMTILSVLSVPVVLVAESGLIIFGVIAMEIAIERHDSRHARNQPFDR